MELPNKGRVFFEGLLEQLPTQDTNGGGVATSFAMPFTGPAPENKIRQRYTNVATTIDKSQPIDIGCAEIFFLNQGTATVVINSVIQLVQFQYIAFSGNENEEDITRYTCIFDNAGTKDLVIIRKVYTA